MEANCREQTLDDVVRVQLVLTSACDLAVPCAVPGIVSMAGTKVVDEETVDRIGAAVLSVAFTADADDTGAMDDAPTLRQSEKRHNAGIVVTHDLQVPVTDGFEAVREAVNTLTGRHFHVVLTTASSGRYLLMALANTSIVSLEEQDVNQQSTLSVQVQSMSHVIALE